MARMTVREGRLIPEIQKAFHYRITEAEAFRVSCYRGVDAGYFHTHRDNDSPAVAYRRFAFSLSLDTTRYEGGGLRFPEYGPHDYSPKAGTALVFATTLLHEALPVTRGQRWVLTTFFCDPDPQGAQRRS